MPLKVLVLAMMLLMVPASVAANPDLRLRTLETENFHFHYLAGEEELVDRIAMNAERAHRNLAIALAHEPTLKTHVILTDSTDLANGMANAVPFPRIHLFAVAPASMSVLGSYDDWIDILITHEMAHVVHIDTVHGIQRLMNTIFGLGVLGKTGAPNLVQPRWVVEGLATMVESDLGSQGRHRSAMFDMFLRVAVLEDRLQSIDQVTSGARVFPHGSSAYLYGLHLMHWIGIHYGRDKIAELSHIYGGRVMPFAVNRAVKDVLGVDFYQLWAEMTVDLRRRFGAEIRQIRARGLRQGRKLTFTASSGASGQHTRHPFWSADDRHIYFYDDDGNGTGGLRTVPATGSRIREGNGGGAQGRSLDIEEVVRIDNAARGSFVGANDDDIIVDVLGRHDLRYSWYDLFRFRGPDRPLEQLTFGSRAREPDVSPDGRSVAFVRMDVGQSRLAFLDLGTLLITETPPLERIAQVYEPVWSPSGRKVAFSGWREGGFRDIYIYDRFTDQVERITASRSVDVSPEWTPDGRYLLFSSDRTGVFNVHALELEGRELFQVTNVVGGAFESSVSHGGRRIVYVGYGSQGYDLWGMDLDPDLFLPALPDERSLRVAKDPTPSIASAGDRRPTDASRPYRAYRTFFPRTVFPSAFEVESSSFLTGISLTLQMKDVIGYHSLVGSYGYLADFRESTGSASYAFTRLIPNFRLDYARDLQVYGGDFRRFVYDPPESSLIASDSGYQVDGYRERVDSAGLTMSLPVLRHPIHAVSAGLRYRFRYYSNIDALDDVVDPNAPGSRLPDVGLLSGVTVDVRYSNASGNRFAYGKDRGRSLSASLTVYDPLFGSDFGSLRLRGAYSERLRMPWRGHQVWASRLSAGISSGGMRRRRSYAVGGLAAGQDVVRSVLNRVAQSEAGSLRGYAPGRYRGRYFTVLNSEFRVPIIDRGMGSLPTFLSRIVLIAFTDWGLAWTDPIEATDIKGSVGASLVFDILMGYGDRVSLFFQYAHGLDARDGLDYFRAAVMRSF